MKAIILIIISLILYAEPIKLINSKTPILNYEMLDKFSHTKKLKSTFDLQNYQYTFVYLKDLKNLLCKHARAIKFSAIDNYEVIFTKEETKHPNIVFAYKINNKKININKKGPAKIIYLSHPKPLKEIFLINKIECINE